jgi:hypothetical protein
LTAKQTKESRERKAREKQDLKELIAIIEGCLASGISCERLKAGLHDIVPSNSTGVFDGTSEISPNPTLSPYDFQLNGSTSDSVIQSQSTDFSTEDIVSPNEASHLNFQPPSTESSESTMRNLFDEAIADHPLAHNVLDHSEHPPNSQPDPTWLQELQHEIQQDDFDLTEFFNTLDSSMKDR